MRPVLVTALAACLALSACQQSGEQQLSVDEAWVSLPAVKGRPGAAYFTLTSSNEPTKLISVTSPRFERSELHDSKMHNGTMSMRPMAGAVFPKGGVLTFEPGGMHAMLFGVDPKLMPGDRIPLTFTFDPLPPVTVEAEVRAPGDLPQAE